MGLGEAATKNRRAEVDERLMWIISVWPSMNEQARRGAYDAARAGYEHSHQERRENLRIVNGGSNG